MAHSKGSCTRVPIAYSGYTVAASSLVQFFGLGLGAGLACAGALRFFATWRRRILGRPLWGVAPGGCCTEAWPGVNTGCSQVAGQWGLDMGTASICWNTFLVMMPSVSSAACRALGWSVGQVRSRCPVSAPWQRMWAARRGGVACPRGGAFWGEGTPWRPLCPVECVVQRFPGRLSGVEDAGGEPQVIPAAWWWRYLIGEVVRHRLPDLAVVVPLHCPPGVPVLES